MCSARTERSGSAVTVAGGPLYCCQNVSSCVTGHVPALTLNASSSCSSSSARGGIVSAFQITNTISAGTKRLSPAVSSPNQNPNGVNARECLSNLAITRPPEASA